MGKNKRVIYTDATKSNKNKYKVAIYDPTINLTHILLLKDVKDINEAEKYGILFALYYINEKQLNGTIILSDSQNSVNNKILRKLASHMNSKISWIPREINQIADKVVKLKPTQKEKVWNSLKLFHDIAFGKI